MHTNWVLTHDATDHPLPSAAVARYARNQIAKAHRTGEPVYIRFFATRSATLTNILINPTTTITQHTPREHPG